MGKIHNWHHWDVHKILPLTFDDSLSYYELISKVIHKLNELGVNVTELYALLEGAITADKIAQETGDSTELVMSQKAVTDALDEILEHLVTSVNGREGDVILNATDIKLTANQQTVEANIQRIDEELGELSRVSGEASGDEWINLTIDGITHSFPTGGGGDEPTEYIKRAVASGNTLTLTKKDETTVVFTVSAVTDVDDSSEIVAENEDGVVTLHLANDVTNKLARALLTPVTPPAVKKVVCVDTNGAQVMEDYVGLDGDVHMHCITFKINDEEDWGEATFTVNLCNGSNTALTQAQFLNMIAFKNINVSADMAGDGGRAIVQSMYYFSNLNIISFKCLLDNGDGTYSDHTIGSNISLISEYSDDVI